MGHDLDNEGQGHIWVMTFDLLFSANQGRDLGHMTT